MLLGSRTTDEGVGTRRHIASLTRSASSHANIGSGLSQTKDGEEDALDASETSAEKTSVAALPVESLITIQLESLPSPLPPKYIEGDQNFHKLSWQRLTSCLICEAIALGALSLPKAFATLGLLWGIVTTIGMGIAAIYTGMIVGEVQLRNPALRDIAEMGRRLFGTAGYRLGATMFLMLLVLVSGSHVLTGAIAIKALLSQPICAMYLSVAAAGIAFVLSLPKTFHNMAILAYIDFASILAAILVTMVVSGVESARKPGGLAAIEWYWILPSHLRPDFVEAVLAISDLAMAYAYAQSLPSFMAELCQPIEYRKSLWTLGLFQIFFYVLTGSLIYVFKGTTVASPALLSISPLMQKVVFGLALPVIFISGSINGQTAAKFIYERIFPPQSPHRFISTRKGITVWILLGLLLTSIAFLLAEAIPSFPTFLALIAALFTAWFTFTLPAMLYFKVVRRQAPRSGNPRIKRIEDVVNVFIFVAGCFIMVAGCTACVISLIREFKRGASRPFSC